MSNRNKVLLFILFFIGGGRVAAHHVATVWVPSVACHLCLDCLQHGAQVAVAEDACSSCPLLVSSEKTCFSCAHHKQGDRVVDRKKLGQRTQGLFWGVEDNEVPAVNGMRALVNPQMSLRQLPLGCCSKQSTLPKNLSDSHFSTPGCRHFSVAADVVHIARNDELSTIAPRA